MSTFSNQTVSAYPLAGEPYWVPQRDASEAIRRIDETLDLISDAMSDLTELSSPSERELSIVIPVHNQRASLPTVLDRIEQTLVLDAEIIVVDDGSVDGTREWLNELPPHPDRRVILRRAVHGPGSAIRVGVRHSTGCVIAIQHVEDDYDPVDLARIVRPIIEGESKAVYGSHYLRGRRDTLTQRTMSWMTTNFSNVVTGARLSEMETVHKAFDGDLLRSIALKEAGFGFESEITAKIASRVSQIREVPISSCRRAGATKRLAWRDTLAAMGSSWKYRAG